MRNKVTLEIIQSFALEAPNFFQKSTRFRFLKHITSQK